MDAHWVYALCGFFGGIAFTVAVLVTWTAIYDRLYGPPKLHWLSPEQMAKLPPEQRRRAMSR